MKTKDCKSYPTKIIAQWGKLLEINCAQAPENIYYYFKGEKDGKSNMKKYKSVAKKLEKSAKKLKDDAKKFDKFIVETIGKSWKKSHEFNASFRNPKNIVVEGDKKEQSEYRKLFKKLKSDYDEISKQLKNSDIDRFFTKEINNYQVGRGLVESTAMALLDEKVEVIEKVMHH